MIADHVEEGSPTAERFSHTWSAVQEPVVLAGPSTARSLAGFAQDVRALTADECTRHEPARAHEGERQDDIVLSSGSTGAPKAIPLTERALVLFAAS
ncbi:hypothetical protein FHX81_1055 [Saccharothrix saharensis]|uniref:AMP-binding enzyme n=2 Tax=Saccharothrix saharensis TaxID=571190 RepID=A0A543J7H2_9PSEU|nr:hypothetical protein FHX81_1055 [Saccharothrix saharensis]